MYVNPGKIRSKIDENMSDSHVTFLPIFKHAYPGKTVNAIVLKFLKSNTIGKSKQQC